VSERDWTDRNAHDPGVTLVQLFVWLSTALMVVIVLRRLIASPFSSRLRPRHVECRGRDLNPHGPKATRF
jgi:hypothetical protein